MSCLGLKSKPTKRFWEAGRLVEHLGMVVDTAYMKISIQDWKMILLRAMAWKLLRHIKRSSWVWSSSFSHLFCGFCIHLTLWLPLAHFYTQSIYLDMSRLSARSPLYNDAPVRLSLQSIWDFQYCSSQDREEGRDIRPVHPLYNLH